MQVTHPGAVESKMTEVQKRWGSWQILVRAGLRHSFAGIDPAEKLKRRKKTKAARAANIARRK